MFTAASSGREHDAPSPPVRTAARRPALVRGLLALVLGLSLAGCGQSSTPGTATETATATGTTATSSPGGAATDTPAATTGAEIGHDQHSGHGAPPGMAMATAAAYPVGATVTIRTDHMPGMSGAEGTVVGAYATTTYAVDYTPTTGGAMVRNHKWVVQEEIRDAGEQPLANGTQVVLTADHMPGMEGAKATIVSSTTQPVYTVDYTPTTGGPMVRDHTWVVQDELAPR